MKTPVFSGKRRAVLAASTVALALGAAGLPAQAQVITLHGASQFNVVRHKTFAAVGMSPTVIAYNATQNGVMAAYATDIGVESIHAIK